MFGIETAYRVQFEGLGAEAVTDVRMERTLSDGRVRVEGLLRQGLALEEEVDIARAETESAGSTVQIQDRQRDNVWTKWLCQQPTTRTWLAANLSASGSSVQVASTAGFSPGDVIHIGTEALLVGAVPDSTTLTITTRGYWDTIAQAHYVGDGENLANPIVTLTRSTTLEGRRVRVFRYVLGEHDLQGDGEQVWLGIATTDAQLDAGGAIWSVRLDNILSILQADLGSGLDNPRFARGVYHPHGLTFLVFEEDNFGIEATQVADFSIRGFWESQAAFVAELNTQFASILGSLDASSLTAFEHSSGVWGYSFTAGAAEKWVNIRILGPGAGAEGTLVPVDRSAVASGEVRSLIAGGNTGAGDVIAGAGTVPRGTFGPGDDSADAAPSLPAEHPNNIYMGGGSSIDHDDAVEIVFGDPDDEEARRVEGLVDAIDTSSRYIQPRFEGEGFAWAGPTAPQISIHRFYARGSVDAFRLALATSAADEANSGDQPFVTLNDVASWADAIEESALGRPVVLSRVYRASVSIELKEMLAHEWRLAGVFPYLTSSGKIGVRPLRLPGPTERADFVLDASNILVDDDPPRFERNTFGSINVVELKTGYDRKEDEHTGRTFTARDVQALSIRKAVRKMEIAPKSVTRYSGPAGSWAGTGENLDVDDVYSIVSRIFGIFARPYSTVKVQVPYTLLRTALIGSIADITSHRIPNVFTGDRGIVGRKGLVIRRAWNFETEIGELTLLLSDVNLGGYTPSVTVVSSTLDAGTTYDVTCSFDHPSSTLGVAPVGGLLSDFFAAGDRVELFEHDALTQTPQVGTVDAVSDGSAELTISFDAAPTFTGTRRIRYAPATAITTTGSTQDDWSFWGDSANQVSFADGDKRTTDYQ